jgi:hypothetical protein
LAQTIDFTIRNIEALPSPATGRVEFKDSRVPGLYLRVTDAGVKTFSFIGRAKGSSRVERVTFGKYPTVKPEEARQRARMLAGDLASGVSAAAACPRRSKSEPPRRPNTEPGVEADFEMVGCG